MELLTMLQGTGLLEGGLAQAAQILGDPAAGELVRPEVALLLLLLLWLVVRRRSVSSNVRAQGDQLLEERFERGEVSRETYDRIREGTHEAGR